MKIRRILGKLANDYKLSGSLLVIFNSDIQMSGLNYRFKGKNVSTDVLAFDLAEKENNNYIDGEIYVNLQIARRQAYDHKVKYLEEVSRLCLHGFLHLLGFSDKKVDDKKVMWQVQEGYLKTHF